MSKEGRLALVAVVSLAALACGGPGGGAAETWTGTINGTDVPALCSSGEFTQAYTVTLSLASPWIGQGMDYLDASGTLSGTETVTTQSTSGACTLEPSTLTNIPFTLEVIQLHSPDQYFFLESNQVIIPHLVDTPSGRADVPVYSLSMWTTAVSASQISGAWQTVGSGSASGNSSEGTFSLTKQ
jgi:hypothetical protein